MRKACCIMIVTILCICCSVLGVAEDGEILFRGIPWGCNPQIFEEKLGIDIDTPYISYLDLWSRWNDVYFGSGDITKYEGGFHFVCSDPDITVAGYKIFTLEAEFVFGITEDGKLNKDIESSCLALAEYTIKSEDNEKTYADLKNKLSSLYGECVSENDISSIWRGNNKTAVRLMKSDSLVYIRYGKEDMEDQMKMVDELIHQELLEEEDKNRKENESITDGL